MGQQTGLPPASLSAAFPQRAASEASLPVGCLCLPRRGRDAWPCQHCWKLLLLQPSASQKALNCSSVCLEGKVVGGRVYPNRYCDPPPIRNHGNGARDRSAAQLVPVSAAETSPGLHRGVLSQQVLSASQLSPPRLVAAPPAIKPLGLSSWSKNAPFPPSWLSYRCFGSAHLLARSLGSGEASQHEAAMHRTRCTLLSRTWHFDLLRGTLVPDFLRCQVTG